MVLGTLGHSSVAFAQSSDYVWIESENTTGGNVKLNATGWGNDRFLSEKKWAQINLEADKVEADLPDGGGLLSYKFNLKSSGNHEIWNRVGFEFVRSPFEWRIDNGEWTNVSPEELTTDLQHIEFFVEIAWLKLGERNLSAGDHTLEIRLPKTKGADGKYQKVFYTSDAILIHPGKFYPNSYHKPDANYRTTQDEEATKNVFNVPAASGATRTVVPLNGLWEIARHDEQMPTEVAVPIQDFPTKPYWTAIPVPSDKNVSRPDLQFAHRLWYRTRVNVPADQIGRSFYLSFPVNSLNTTVYVNGTYCGFSNTPLTRADIDITKGVKPGVNEVWVGIRDAWYGRNYNPDKPLKLRKTFNTPINFFGNGFQDMAYPVWNNPQSGILETPELVVAGGPVYAADVFVKPSVAKKQMVAEITLLNTSNAAASGEIQWAAIDDKTGAVAKTFKSQPFSLAANGKTTLNVADAWANPKLWWPNEPNMYRLRTTISVGGKPVDVQETLFGFREWTSRGIDFVLNGVRWQQWADLTPLEAQTKEEFLKIYRNNKQRTFRLMMPGQGANSWRWMGMPLREALEFFDRNGVVVRRNALLDGQAIGYAFSEGDEDLKKKYGTEMKALLMKNWRETTLAQVRAERNHASINIWTIENEFAFINLINLLGNGPLMDEYEREITKVSDACMKEDPTRW
jgi:beta-galactosidase